MTIKLMLVDNLKIFRAGLCRLLQAQADIEVVAEADSGVEAVTLAQTHHPEVILMGATKPTMNEREAARQLKACCPSAAILVLINYHLNHDERDYFTQMLDAGASGCIPQQATLDDLFLAIRTI